MSFSVSLYKTRWAVKILNPYYRWGWNPPSRLFFRHEQSIYRRLNSLVKSILYKRKTLETRIYKNVLFHVFWRRLEFVKENFEANHQIWKLRNYEHHSSSNHEPLNRTLHVVEKELNGDYDLKLYLWGRRGSLHNLK